MASFTWKYQVFCLLSLLLHSQVSFPLSFSSSLSSMSPCFALLQFNKSIALDRYASSLIYRENDMCEGSYPKTTSWMEDKECCSWDGVECDKTTGHVIGLDLGCSWLNGSIHSNSSLFFLRHLRRLNLAGNYFNDSLLPSEFGKFKSLTHLKLSSSYFSGQIPYEISQLSSLVSLDLSFNSLSIETPVWKRVVDNLTQLRELLLDQTDMSSIRPNSLMNLSSYLTTLSLRECGLQGKLEDNILCLPSLQITYLDLSHNNFTGSIPASIGNLTHITSLDLSYNNFSGEIQLPLSNFGGFQQPHQTNIF
jgi:Leucine-rich repeat (LRR) protein